MNPITILSNRKSIRNSLSKFLQSVRGLSISIPDIFENLPEQFKDNIDKNEILISEAMKRSCNKGERVFIIGIDKKDTVEKDIDFDRLRTLIKFIPYPINTLDLFLKSKINKIQFGLEREERCSSGQYKCTTGINEQGISNIYAGELLSRIAHALDKSVRQKNIDRFKEVYVEINALNYLFVPDICNERSEIRRFIKEMNKLIEISDSSPEVFYSEAEAVLKKESFKYFPYFWYLEGNDD